MNKLKRSNLILLKLVEDQYYQQSVNASVSYSGMDFLDIINHTCFFNNNRHSFVALHLASFAFVYNLNVNCFSNSDSPLVITRIDGVG